MDQKEFDKVIAALEDPKWTWRTVDSVARETGIPPDEVARLLAEHPGEIVRSSVRSRSGEDLFTTRRHFQEKASVGEKIIGAFKNRLN